MKASYIKLGNVLCEGAKCPTFTSYKIKYPDNNKSNGSISDVIISGGTAPYTLSWKGPDSYTANTLNIEDLSYGVYSGTVTDSRLSATTEVVKVLSLSALTFSATVIDNSCVTNNTKYCKIKVDSFTGTQATFTYELYKDGVIVDKYNGIKGRGQDVHTFDKLKPGFYTLTAYDGYKYDFDFNGISACTTTDIDMVDSPSTFFGPVLSADTFTEEWEKISFANEMVIGTASTTYPSGYDPINNTFNLTNPSVWLYTGATVNRLTDSTQGFYVRNTPESEMATYDGEDKGPTSIAKVVGNVGTFYYSTLINKFVFLKYADQKYRWITYLATQDLGGNGNPTASFALTSGDTRVNVTTTFTRLAPIETKDVTVSGSTHAVVSAITKTYDAFGLAGTSDKGTPRKLGIFANTNIPTGIISRCSYLNYTYETTLWADSVDDDQIGIILTCFNDIDGKYGPKNLPHQLSLVFDNHNNNYCPSTSIRYNYGSSAFSFRTVYPGAEENNTIGNRISVLSGSSTPFKQVSSNSFSLQGSVRARIQRKGEFGERFIIQLTDTMGIASYNTAATKDLGDTNPYNDNYTFDLNILDISTWTGTTMVSSGPKREGNELEKFVGPGKIGYIANSQTNSYFYDFNFSGYQVTSTAVLSSEGQSSSKYFDLYDSDTIGLESTSSITSDYNKSFNDAFIGKPSVPVVRPTVKVEIQNISEPTVKMSGATKIENKEPIIYNSEDLETIQLDFLWSGETTDLFVGNSYAKYDVFPYLPEYGQFSSNSIGTRIFDKLNGSITGKTGVNIVKADELGVKALDYENYWEYMIKPSYIVRDKISSLRTNPCGSYEKLTGNTQSEKWFDTLSLNEEYNREYGIYDKDKDYYFVVLTDPSEVIKDTTEINFERDTGKYELYHQQHEALSGSPTNNPSASTTPYIMSGRTFVLPLDFPTNGAILVNINGLTLIEGTEEDINNTGDWYKKGDAVYFKAGILEPLDIINMYYIPGSFYKSYHTEYITVPSSVVTGETTTAALYTDGNYYYVKLTYESLGSAGLIFNGSILSEGSDFTMVDNTILRLNKVLYPGGLITNDQLIIFYLTEFTLLGNASTKNPKLFYNYKGNPRVNEELKLTVRDYSGYTVYSEIKTINKKDYELTQYQFTIEVPTPGTYSYNIKTTRFYDLITNDTVKTEKETQTVNFDMSRSVFYGGDIDTETTINTIYK